MSTNIASKNLYELLGNDPELDPDRAPEPPTKVIDKPVQRTGKRNAGAEGPSRDTPRPAAGGRGGRDAALTRGDQAGSLNNRAEQRDDGVRQDRQSNRTRDAGEGGRGRGGRGGRGSRGGRGGPGRSFRDPRDDRHSHTGVGDQEKQAAHGWGNATDGQAEWTDETAGEAIAKAEEKQEAADGDGDAAAPEDAAPAEAEEKTKSYDQYLAEQAEKRLALGGSLQTRKANEGSKQKAEGTEFSRKEEDFFSGSGAKARKEKEAKQKDVVVLDGQYYAAPDANDRGRGGRGGGRGGRGSRGGDRGRGNRGRGDSRGDFRGGSRGAPRGGFNANDSSAFPALGA